MVTHIEPVKLEVRALKTENKALVDRVKKIATQRQGIKSCHNICATMVDEKLQVTMHCTFDDHLEVDRVHEIITQVEEEIKKEMKEVSDVVIHPEPDAEAAKNTIV